LKAGKWEEVHQVMDKMRIYGPRPDPSLYQLLSQVCLSESNTEEADALLKGLKADRVQPSPSFYGALAGTYAGEPGGSSRALELLENAMACGVDTTELTTISNDILTRLRQRGDGEGMWQAYQLMRAKSVPADGVTYSNTISLLTSMGQYQRALEMFAALKTD